ncbi:thiamine pyrophosphate carrier protein 1 [Leptinotarsa decemlineata]|uniref:thiamine pyrophosphate carrier protein 1 n=1 Tax=Leptinotarsa decemlineata TaxID=7539 RepID=UPI003D3077EA
MVGYKKHKNLTQLDFAIAGGLSGFITRSLCQPLDVLKIRFQLQVEPISNKSHSKYYSVIQAVNVIFHEEGIKAFWKGHVPAQWLSVTYGTVQFWSFEVLSKKAQHYYNSSNAPVVNFCCGSIAGCTATLVSFPFDVIRTRLVAQSEQRKLYKGVWHSFQDMVTKEGFPVLFRGLLVTIGQVGPHSGIQFMCYKVFDDICKRVIGSDSTSFSSSLVAGSLAGLCAKTCIYPFDLAKKRLQIQGFENARTVFGKHFRCSGLTDCLVKIYQNEGVLGFFKGLCPSLIKASLTTALHFSTYEMVCRFLVSLK